MQGRAHVVLAEGEDRYEGGAVRRSEWSEVLRERVAYPCCMATLIKPSLEVRVGEIARVRAYMHSPFAQRQVCGAGVRAEALGRAADNDGDRLARAFAQDVGARLLADGTYAEREQNVAVERDVEVGRERKQVRDDARELRGEARRCARVSARQWGGRGGTCLRSRMCTWRPCT